MNSILDLIVTEKATKKYKFLDMNHVIALMSKRLITRVQANNNHKNLDILQETQYFMFRFLLIASDH